MWKSVVGHGDTPDVPGGIQSGKDEEWETDPDFINDVSEEEQRWGSKTIQGSGRTAGAIDMQKLVSEISQVTSAELARRKKETHYEIEGLFSDSQPPLVSHCDARRYSNEGLDSLHEKGQDITNDSNTTDRSDHHRDGSS